MRKLKQLLLVALIFALTACGASRTAEVAPQSVMLLPSPHAAVSVIAKAEAPLDVRDDEVVWGASEDFEALVSETEGEEHGGSAGDSYTGGGGRLGVRSDLSCCHIRSPSS